MAKDMKTFQTINLSDYYSNNGSQYSTMGDITHYSEGGKRFDNTSPIDQKLSDQTPIDDFIKALKNPKALAEVQEKSGIEVFPSPSTPTKIGISTTGFNFAPAFTVPNTTGFTFIPSFLTPTVANNMTSPINAGLSVSNNMTSPINAGLSVYNTMAAPNHGYGILGIHDGIPNVNATGFTPNTMVHLNLLEYLEYLAQWITHIQEIPMEYLVFIMVYQILMQLALLQIQHL